MSLDGEVQDLVSVPISMVSHTLFCPRRAWLEAMGEKAPQSFAMKAGQADHKGTHDPDSGTRRQMRGIDVVDRTHGFHGRIDTAEVLPSGELHLTEYKATPVRREPVVDPQHRTQLALQAIALEANGYTIDRVSVFFTTHHRHVDLDLTDQDREAALRAVDQTRAIVDSPVAPPPLEDSPRCKGCSHVAVCLPDERQERPVHQQIRVSDPDGQVLHLATYGSRASLRAGRITVVKGDEKLMSVPIEQVSGVVVHGNVDLSSGLQREILWRGICLVWCSSSGRVVGWSRSAASPNGSTRVRQHVASAEGRLGLAREFIAAKVANQGTILRRHGGMSPEVKGLRALTSEAAAAPTLGHLFGVEGTAARIYFEGFPDLLNGLGSAFAAAFPGRIGRGAQDPLNICLNYTYALLQAEVLRAVVSCGLDPHAGFLHSSSRNKPALVLDLMEEFRAPVADSVVLGAINNGEVNGDRFRRIGPSFRIDDQSRKALIAAFERRVKTEFTHPVFGYKVSWRRAMEIQARMVLGYLDGTQSSYVGVKIR